ncbi:DUF6714 family protein [Pedobacter lithocola]|uniref:DUF6714 family protein n=1 Tax=Pedobacter lithocola TaxID=1908239 RepID=A0ABV8PC68_9SPHI
MLKTDLINKIKLAFKDVRLENGIGLWEAQGLDDYADDETLKSLRTRDERINWENLSYQDLAYCESSLAFFDAKGMRFCLPQFLIFDILEAKILKEQNLSSPEVVFALTNDLHSECQLNRFSLFNTKQMECVISFLHYKLAIIEEDEENYFYKQLKDGITFWSDKLGN